MVINFSYFVIRFLLNSSIVKFDKYIGKVSAALQNRPQDFFIFFIFQFLFIFLNMKPLSEVASGVLVIQIPIQAVCLTKVHFNVIYKKGPCD